MLSPGEWGVYIHAGKLCGIIASHLSWPYLGTDASAVWVVALLSPINTPAIDPGVRDLRQGYMGPWWLGIIQRQQEPAACTWQNHIRCKQACWHPASPSPRWSLPRFRCRFAHSLHSQPQFGGQGPSGGDHLCGGPSCPHAPTSAEHALSCREYLLLLSSQPQAVPLGSETARHE